MNYGNGNISIVGNGNTVNVQNKNNEARAITAQYIKQYELNSFVEFLFIGLSFMSILYLSMERLNAILYFVLGIEVLVLYFFIRPRFNLKLYTDRFIVKNKTIYFKDIIESGFQTENGHPNGIYTYMLGDRTHYLSFRRNSVAKYVHYVVMDYAENIRRQK